MEGGYVDRYTPRCKCNVPAVLRCAQRRKESRGKYMWMCHVGNKPGEQGYVSIFHFYYLPVCVIALYQYIDS